MNIGSFREPNSNLDADGEQAALTQAILGARARGRTTGYLSGFLAWGTYVYGTGWSYSPYWYSWPGYGYPIYYPRPYTWGVSAYYNPIRGTYGRYGYAYGPYRGIAGARA